MRSSQRTYGKRKPWGLFLLFCLAGLIFCSIPFPAVDAAELKAELVNKKDEGMLATVLTGPVQLTYPDGRTRLLPYRSHLQPVVANGKVYIFTTKEGDLTGLVVYDNAKGRGQSFPLPEDLKLNSYFGQPSFSPDGTKVAYYYYAPAQYGFINLEGKVVIRLENMPSSFSDGLARIQGANSGFIDKTGRMVIRGNNFRNAGNFSEGLASISNERGLGFIDRRGKIVVQPQYRRPVYDADFFSEGLACVGTGSKMNGDGKFGFIDKTGQMVISPRFPLCLPFSEGRAPVLIGDKWGFIDRTGKVVIPPQYVYIERFSEGLAPVRIEGQWKWGFINQAGEWVIPPRYDVARPFSEGKAAVELDGLWGFIDKTGAAVIPTRFVGMPERFSDGYSLVMMPDESFAFIDESGRTAITLKAQEVYPFSQGLARVKVDGKYGFIDKHGTMVIPAQFEEAEDFSEGLAAILISSGGCGVQVCSWPDWHLLWESPLLDCLGTDVPPVPPVWKNNSQAEFDPHFFYPPRFLKYQAPEPGGKHAQ
jgi:hypothetical protein